MNQLFEVTVKFKISDHKIKKFHTDRAPPQTGAIQERKLLSPQRKVNLSPSRQQAGRHNGPFMSMRGGRTQRGTLVQGSGGDRRARSDEAYGRHTNDGADVRHTHQPATLYDAQSHSS